MISRREAMTLLGAMTACLGGRMFMAMADDTTTAYTTSGVYMDDTVAHPIDYVFSASGIKNIVIERENKPDLIIPFADVVAALEGTP